MLGAHWLQVQTEHMARFTATKEHMATRERQREREKSQLRPV